MYRTPSVGDVVVFCNPKGQDINAIVCCVFQEYQGAHMINCVHVSIDTNREDSCGRQTEKPTSISHVSLSGVHGFYWRWPDEPKNEYVPPLEK